MFLGIAIAVWVVTGFISYGIHVHEYQRRYDYHDAFPFALFVFALGPVSLFSTVYLHRGPWGFQLKPRTREERYRNFVAEYPSLNYTREQFDEEY